MSTSDSVSKFNDDGVCELVGKLQNMNMALSVCANCGKENNSDNMNTCNKCKQVKYCNAVCKKVHKKKHKKDCDEHIRLAAEKHNEELRIAAELHDEKLFKQPPPAEDCPICFIRLPTLNAGTKYYACCGKVICSGCSFAPLYDNQGNEVDIIKQNECPFCRTVAPKTDEGIVERVQKRVEVNDDDAHAIYNMGNYYFIAKDYTKALELWHRAGELGHAKSYQTIGAAYDNGEGLEFDKKKARHYYEQAAIGGDVEARCNLGFQEGKAGNMDRAIKHFMIAVGSGCPESLGMIQKMYRNRKATKDDYTAALQLYQAYLGEIKSPQRDEAAAALENYRYY